MLLTIKPLTFDVTVRHVGPDDALSSVAVSNTTKQLEQRELKMAEAFNALLEELKSQNQLVPLTYPTVSVGPLEIFTLGHFHVPKGYEATVLNAIVSSSPVANKVLLVALHSSATFGSSGSSEGVTRLVETLNQYTTNGSYVQEGELIVRLENGSASRLDVTCSLLLALKQLA